MFAVLADDFLDRLHLSILAKSFGDVEAGSKPPNVRYWAEAEWPELVESGHATGRGFNAAIIACASARSYSVM